MLNTSKPTPILLLPLFLAVFGQYQTKTQAQVFTNPLRATHAVTWSPATSFDGEELYYSRGDYDLWRSRFDTTTGTWVGNRKVVELASSAQTDGATLSTDGLTMILSRRENQQSAWRLWQTTRADADSPWGPPNTLSEFDSLQGDMATPSLSADGLTLYFSSGWLTGGGVLEQEHSKIWWSTRESVKHEWGPPSVHPVSAQGALDSYPSISADGLSLYFSSNRPGGYGSEDIYVATRETTDDEFGPPLNLGPTVNSDRIDVSPHIDADGSLYYTPDSQFVSEGASGWEIYRLTPDENPVPGDFDNDDMLTVADIDIWSVGSKLWTRNPRSRVQTVGFDLNNDGQQTVDDLTTWVKELNGTWIGDANLDGEFNSSDLTLVFKAAHYEDGKRRNSSWSTGDWNGDLDFDTSDLVFTFQDGGYERGPRQLAHVPEPAMHNVVVFVAMATLLVHVRNRLRHGVI